MKAEAGSPAVDGFFKGKAGGNSEALPWVSWLERFFFFSFFLNYFKWFLPAKEFFFFFKWFFNGFLMVFNGAKEFFFCFLSSFLTDF